MIVCIVAIILLIAVDQAVKYWVVAHLALGETAPLLPGFVELLRLHNYGAAWSSFSGMRYLLIALTVVLMIFLAVLLVKKIVRHPLGLTAVTLTLAGGIGNLIDRVRLGYVVDMFNFQFMSYPVFNVADMCIVFGVILLLVYYLFFYDKYDSKKARLQGKGGRKA